MAKQSINVGTAANDKKGDSLRAAFQKVNANFTELYTALGLVNDVTLSLGAFTFTGSTMNTDDSTAIVIDKPITVNGEITVDGDIVPKTNLGASLGTPTRQFKSLYVSTNTIYINNVPLSLDPGTNTLKVNNLPISQRITYTDIPNAPTDISDLTDNTNLLGGVTASSSTSFTNKTINIAFGQGNTFQIQGNSITSYSGSGAVVALTNLPTLNGINVNNSSLTIDGGTGNYYWRPTAFDGTGTIHKAGIYKSNPDANNALFTFGANSTGNMSVAVEGSLFIGTAMPSNNGGLNTDYPGWLVVQSGGKFGGDINTRGSLIFDDAQTGAVVFADGSRQSTAADFGYLDLDKDTIKGTAGYQYTFNTDGYFTSSTSSESPNYFFVTYNSTNLNIAAGWTVVGANCNTTVSSVVYPVAGYPGVIRVNLTAAASGTVGFYPVTVTSPDRLKVQIQPNPGNASKFGFATSSLTFPDGATYTGSEIIGNVVPAVGGTASANETGITYSNKIAIFTEGAFTNGVWTDVQPGWTVTDNNGFTDTIASRGGFGAASFVTTVNNWPAPASGKTYVFTSPDYEASYSESIEITVGSNTWSFDNSGDITFPDTTVQTTAWRGIPGPYADDAAAASAGVAVGYPYHKTGTSGQVFVRLA